MLIDLATHNLFSFVINDKQYLGVDIFNNMVSLLYSTRDLKFPSTSLVKKKKNKNKQYTLKKSVIFFFFFFFFLNFNFLI